MLFNSYEFIFLFLPITFCLYFYLNHKQFTKSSKVLVVGASLFFYSWWNPAYLPLILSSILFNFFTGSRLANLKSNSGKLLKKLVLAIGISANIALLGYFKYMDFFIGGLNYLFNSNYGMLNLMLPLAISFFTFQQIAYLVDSYRGETKETSLLNYALFVSFFPQLIAGPIVHHKEMMPQFVSTSNRLINYNNIAIGLFIFSIGLFKKVVIADSLSPVVASGFDASTSLTIIEAWTTSLSYTFQLYFDFSGYADMAIGLALLFNIQLPINFNSPYKALNIQDFWRRWHMTLSRFLKDYIYVPLGGNKQGDFRTYNNLLATFVIGGIWHGAGILFILWGAFHGVAIITHRLWLKTRLQMPKWLAWFITFNFINVTWVFFRAKEWDDATKVLSGLFAFSEFIPATTEYINELMTRMQSLNFYQFVDLLLDVANNLYLAFLLFIVLWCTNSNNKIKYFRFSKKELMFSALIFSVCVVHLYANQASEFLYFNF